MQCEIGLANEFIELKSKEKILRSQVKSLEKYLGVSGAPEDELINAEDARIS